MVKNRNKRKNSVDELPPDLQMEEDRLSRFLSEKQRAEKELVDLEQKIYNLEKNYIEETHHSGNLIKGFSDFLKRSDKGDKNKKANSSNNQLITPEMRIFSNSSTFTKSLQFSIKEEDEHFNRLNTGLSSPNTPMTGPKKMKRKRKQIQDSDDESIRNFSNLDDDEDPTHLDI